MFACPCPSIRLCSHIWTPTPITQSHPAPPHPNPVALRCSFSVLATKHASPPLCSDLSHNYLTGPALEPLAEGTLDLSTNFLSGPLPEGACQPFSFDANCFKLPPGCDLVLQRQEAACNAFCGVSSAAACGGHGVCYPEGLILAPTCLCVAGYARFGEISCVAQDRNMNYSRSQSILPPETVLTKGTQRETRGSFTAAPVILFAYEAGKARLGCGLELAFHANFTFSLSPQSGRVGFNGFAFVVSATNRVGSGAGVGYGGMDKQSVAVEFDTRQDKQHGDMSSQHVGLNIQGKDRSIAAVRSPFPLSNRKAYTAWVDYEPRDPGTIQGAAEQPAFFFGFVASTTVKPFQRHVILESAVDTGLPASPRRVTRIPAYGLRLSTDTYLPEWASPFPHYVSADYRVAPDKQDSWVVSDFHSWDSVPFLGWPVKDQSDCKLFSSYPGACWAFAVVASVEAAYGIAMNGEAPQLSVESLFAAMGLTSEADKCSTGGSPTEALERLVALPRGGVTEAGAPTFKYQDPECYTGRLNHVVLVIGYFVLRNDGSQNRIAPPFWIIRNSWGVEWGDRGHMRMDIQGGDGVCGINVLPGIYPIVKRRHMLVSTQLGITSSNLTALNPALNCSEPIKAGRSLCIERNNTFAFTVPRCLQYGMLTVQNTCERLLLQVSGSGDDPARSGKMNAMRWAELYRNNPGLICSNVIPASASAVGSNTGVQVRGGGEPGWEG
ncbi:unnamed protein product [Closterium sp. Naga37s-1]|nr:unnamed protein product [Closterium sp. Naga37s-1]